MTSSFITEIISIWLEAQGYNVHKGYRKIRGIDIEASHRGERWILAQSGVGSRPAMYRRNFLTALGKILLQMNQVAVRYSVVFPDLPEYRQLWATLPEIAKTRIMISAIFVDTDGNVEMVD
jgi:hypothetical protein